MATSLFLSDIKFFIDKIIDYIIESEMNGELDKNDPFYPTVQGLREILTKIEDETN